MVKNPPAIQETQVGSLGWEGPLEEEMATHFSILAWRIPWTEEPRRLQSMGLQRVGRNLVTKHSHLCNLYNHCIITPVTDRMTHTRKILAIHIHAEKQRQGGSEREKQDRQRSPLPLQVPQICRLLLPLPLPANPCVADLGLGSRMGHGSSDTARPSL